MILFFKEKDLPILITYVGSAVFICLARQPQQCLLTGIFEYGI